MCFAHFMLGLGGSGGMHPQESFEFEICAEITPTGMGILHACIVSIALLVRIW